MLKEYMFWIQENAERFPTIVILQMYSFIARNLLGFVFNFLISTTISTFSCF